MYLDPPKGPEYDWEKEYEPGKYPGGFFLNQTDLWLANPFFYLTDAIEAGFHKFMFNQAAAEGSGTEVLSFVRANALHTGVDVRVMIMDRHGASEYSMFSPYHRPMAVYPVWSQEDRFEDLIRLCEEPIGSNRSITDNAGIPTNLRPVYGQPHKVIVRRGYNKSMRDMDVHELQAENDRFAGMMSGVQRMYPDLDLMIVGSTRFDILFGHGFKSASYQLHYENGTRAYAPLLTLPNGHQLTDDIAFESKWKDWFELVGWKPEYLTDKRKQTQFALTSLQWASRYFNSITPFVHNASSRANILSPEFWQSRGTEFKLPESRRKLMRNPKINASEYDRFTCDTCILAPTCKLFRQGSVCVVKGSEAVSLAENFGTRNVNTLIGGLVKLVEKQAQRLDDSMAAEEFEGELNPEVTKQFNQLFANGVKLAKLLDPSLNGGPAVSVNVGVGAGGVAAISSGNPRAIVANVVAELEASGIPRDKITPDMIRGVLTSMGEAGAEVASATVAVGGHVAKHDGVKALPTAPVPDDGVPLAEFFGYEKTVEGQVVNG